MPPKAYAYWEWRADSGVLKPFGKEESMALEKHFRQHKSGTAHTSTSASSSSPTLQLDIAGTSYTFDVVGMTQTNDSTGYVRDIVRVAPPKGGQEHNNNNNNNNNNGGVSSDTHTNACTTSPSKKKLVTESGAASASGDLPPSAATGQSHYTWQWRSHDSFVDYDPLTSTKIENAFVNDALVVNIGSIPVSDKDTADVKIHFGYMHQENKDSGVIRRIRRVLRDGPAPALFSAPPVTTPYNTTTSAEAAAASASEESSAKKPRLTGAKRSRSPSSQ